MRSRRAPGSPPDKWTCSTPSSAASRNTRNQVAVSSSPSLGSSASGFEQYGQPSGQRWVSSASRPSGLCTIAEPDNATGRLIHCSVRARHGTSGLPTCGTHPPERGQARVPFASMPVWPACAVQDVRDQPGNDDLYPDSKSFCRPSRAALRDDFLARRHSSNTGAVNRPFRTDVNGPGSELGRQIPVDLEADADLNEGRGRPGHWSSSLQSFLNKKKVKCGGPARKPAT